MAALVILCSGQSQSRSLLAALPNRIQYLSTSTATGALTHDWFAFGRRQPSWRRQPRSATSCGCSWRQTRRWRRRPRRKQRRRGRRCRARSTRGASASRLPRRPAWSWRWALVMLMMMMMDLLCRRRCLHVSVKLCPQDFLHALPGFRGAGPAAAVERCLICHGRLILCYAEQGVGPGQGPAEPPQQRGETAQRGARGGAAGQPEPQEAGGGHRVWRAAAGCRRHRAAALAAGRHAASRSRWQPRRRLRCAALRQCTRLGLLMALCFVRLCTPSVSVVLTHILDMTFLISLAFAIVQASWSACGSTSQSPTAQSRSAWTPTACRPPSAPAPSSRCVCCQTVHDRHVADPAGQRQSTSCAR